MKTENRQRKSNKVRRLVCSGILPLCAAIAVIFAVFRTEASDGKEIQYMERTYTAVATVPEEIPDGYLFGGWYAKDGKVYTAVKSPELNQEYYAKFVPEEVLGIKAQVTNDLIENGSMENPSIRFVTSIDALDYKGIGFKIQKGAAGEMEDKGTSSRVYEMLYAVDATAENPGAPMADSDTAKKYAASDLFHPTSSYFKTWTIRNIPAEVYDTDITVIPYWITLDGTRVEGTTSIKTVNLGRSWIYLNSNASSEAGAYGTKNHPFTNLEDALNAIIVKGGKITVAGGENQVQEGFQWKQRKKAVGNITIIGENNSTLDFSQVSNMGINDDVTFTNINLQLASNVYANGHKLKIADDVTANNPTTTLYGGANGTSVAETNLEISAGTYGVIYGGCKEASVNGPARVVINHEQVLQGETEIYAGSNNGSAATEETGILIFNHGSYDETNATGKIKTYNYLVTATAGGSVTADKENIHIAPENVETAGTIKDSGPAYFKGNVNYALATAQGNKIDVDFADATEAFEDCEASIGEFYYSELKKAMDTAKGRDLLIVTLVDDCKLDSTYSLGTAGATLNLCLNGKTLTGPNQDRVFTITSDTARLSISDSEDNVGRIVGMNNTDNKQGGLIFVQKGKLELHGGTLKQTIEEAGTNGMVVKLGNSSNKGIFKMYGGTITGGKTSGNGGGVNIATAQSEFYMYGGTIENCNAGEKGGGVYVASTATFELSGAAKITGNSANGKANNVYLNDNAKFTVKQLTEEASVGITTPEVENDTLIGSADADPAGKIFNDKHQQQILFKQADNTLIMGIHCHCGGVLRGDSTHTCEAVEWKSWSGTETNGYYYLTEDKDITASLTISNNTSLELCLNGHTLTGPEGKRVFYLQGDNSRLSICDCGKDGTIKCTNGSGDNGGLAFVYKGTMNLYGGTLKQEIETAGAKGTVVKVGNGTSVTGTFNMCGGTITGGNVTATGGGVTVVGKESTFNMYGGTIRNCTAGTNGGGVYVENGKNFTMSGGTIEGCSAVNGGGVYVAGGGFFTQSGGNIEGCSVTANGGGVYVAPNADVTLSGTAKITGNTNGTVDRDLYLTDGAVIKVEKLLDGASVGISATSQHPDIIGTADADPYGKLFSNREDREIQYIKGTSQKGTLQFSEVNPELRMLSYGNSILTGAVYTFQESRGEVGYDHLAAYNNAPYGRIASALGIKEANVTHTLISSTGLLYKVDNNKPSQPKGSFLDNIKKNDLFGYDVVLTHLWLGDMNTYQIGTENAVAGDGTLAGGVVELLQYIQQSNPSCKLILVGVPPVSKDEGTYGDEVFTCKYKNGSSIAECDQVMRNLAEKYKDKFVFVDWEDLDFAKNYQNVHTAGPNVHASSEETYRQMGDYLGGKVKEKNIFQ